MTWEQKLAALDKLAGVGELRMRAPGNWFCSHRVDIKDRSILRGGAGNGVNPEEAVLNQWERLTTDLKSHEYIVIDRGSGPRRAVRWNGYMWDDVDEKAEAA